MFFFVCKFVRLSHLEPKNKSKRTHKKTSNKTLNKRKLQKQQHTEKI